MSLIKVEGSNIFQWKISQIDKGAQTGIFSIDGCDFEVIYDCSRTMTKLSQFRLYSPCRPVFPVSYTFGILDREGHVFVSSKGKVLKFVGLREREFLNIDISYLKAWAVTENGTLTVCFSVSRFLDAPQIRLFSTKAEASNVADGTTKTKPLVTKDSSTNTDASVKFLETLSSDFSTFYESKTDTDCVLKVNDAQFRVHRAVLSARSSVFSAMFHHDTAEKSSGEVNIPDVKATALNDVLYYLYSGKMRGLTADTATSIYTAADKYDLLELKTECLELLKQELTLDNFCEAAILAHTHGEMELEERVVWFIEDKLDEVLESTSWQQFIKDKTLLANKLLTSALKTAKNKQSPDITSK